MQNKKRHTLTNWSDVGQSPSGRFQIHQGVEKASPIIGMPHVFGWSREFVVIIQQ